MQNFTSVPKKARVMNDEDVKNFVVFGDGDESSESLDAISAVSIAEAVEIFNQRFDKGEYDGKINGELFRRFAVVGF